MTWRWLKEDVVIAMHSEQIAEHGGSLGIRDAGLLSSALARPQNQAAYGEPSVFDLAAAYAFGVIQNHPFVDGNKRVGFLAAYAFLDLNGWELMASEAEAVAAVLALATGQMDEAGFSDWLKNNSLTGKT
ncbi:MAG: type II toxin-antitoxin system death-on-curing family toxin [Desulfobacterales bacterium]|jgi:death-on-curing protein